MYRQFHIRLYLFLRLVNKRNEFLFEFLSIEIFITLYYCGVYREPSNYSSYYTANYCAKRSKDRPDRRPTSRYTTRPAHFCGRFDYCFNSYRSKQLF